jgi:trans-2,3-dihydro-3-hydroxyanthranilate isomerase
MKLPYATVDVFTTQRFGGNPLAVVLDGRGLSTDQMQQIATEFNYSETTFVLPPEDSANTARVRIFTPRAEVPFAGHPNVGTAFVLAREAELFGNPIGERLLFEENAGLVRVDTMSDGEQVAGAQLEAPELFSIGDTISPGRVVECCALNPTDVDVQHHEPCIASAGLPFAFAAVNSREALSQANPQVGAFDQYLPADQAAGLCLYHHAPGGMVDVHARVFAPLHGVPEDPATGSANVALAGLLATTAPDDKFTLERTVAQGVDMGRPSLLFIAADKSDGAVTATRVGGRCVPVMSGTFLLD